MEIEPEIQHEEGIEGDEVDGFIFTRRETLDGGRGGGDGGGGGRGREAAAMARDGPPEGEVCSICHSEFTVPCQANCSHWFCGDCILQAWHYGSALQPCRCPLCRRPIGLLIPTEASLWRRHTPGVGRVLQQLEGYNHAFGGGSSGIIQKLRDLPFLLGRLMRDLRDPQRTLPLFIRFRVYLAMALSAIYFLSPVDIIPEGVVGFIGLLDDAFILLICAVHVANIYRSVLVSRHGG